MSIKENVIKDLNSLSKPDIGRVAEYINFLKFRGRLRTFPVLDEEKTEAIYAEFADEDKDLAEAGIPDFTEGLAKEDVR